MTGILWYMLITSGSLHGQNVVIKGSAPQYQGEKLVFFTYTDQITYLTKNLGSCIVSSTGKFELNIDIDKTIRIFTDLGIYKAYLYVEPGKEYSVVLPARADKAPQDQLNPYFKAREIHLGILNHDREELNYVIRHFDDSFNPYLGNYALKAYLQTDFTDLDSVIREIGKPYEKNTNLFFRNYKRYKIALLRHMSIKQKSRSQEYQQYIEGEIFYNNPAYMEWFNQVYHNYFTYVARTENMGGTFHEIIDVKKSLHGLIETINKNEAFRNDSSFIELVILKGLYDAFYSKDFAGSSILEILDTLGDESHIPEHRNISENIQTKLTHLLAGSYAPVFELADFHDSIIRLPDLKGKYVYLNFCTSMSYPCINQFVQLKALYEKYSKILEILTISVDKDRERMNRLIDTGGYHWIFLDAGNHPAIIKSYDVRAFPTYFLIDPEGTFVLSPAPGPGEKFEKMFLDLLRSGK